MLSSTHAHLRRCTPPGWAGQPAQRERPVRQSSRPLLPRPALWQVVLETEAASYVCVRPAVSYKKVHTHLSEEADICCEVCGWGGERVWKCVCVGGGSLHGWRGGRCAKATHSWGGEGRCASAAVLTSAAGAG